MPLNVFTARDQEILAALDRCPLTATQLLRLSRTFPQPFPHERLVRRRIQQLCESGLVRRVRYTALAGRAGTPNCYLLTALGYRLLYGADEPLPTKRVGHDIAPSRHQHTHALADFVVRVSVAAHALGIAVSGFHGENRVQLTGGELTVYPDCAFQFMLPSGRALSYFVEIDNRSERVCSPKDTDSWERKMRAYEAVQDCVQTRFRLLVVCTRGSERINHILATARRVAQNPRRALAYAVALPEFLCHSAPLTEPLFRDHHGRSVSLVAEQSFFTPTAIAPTDPSELSYSPCA
jgi:hypothetical protein